MGQAALVVVLQDRAGIHDQPKLGAMRRTGIHPDVVPEPVGEFSDGDRGIDRERRILRDAATRGRDQ
jgi:hypothetical protein